MKTKTIYYEPDEHLQHEVLSQFEEYKMSALELLGYDTRIKALKKELEQAEQARAALLASKEPEFRELFYKVTEPEEIMQALRS